MKKKPSEEKEEAQASAPPAAPAVPETPEADAVSAEIKVLEDQMLRLRADFENYRKRSARERQEWTERAAEELLTQLLPVLDHFELGLKTAREHQTDTAVVDGFQLVYDQLQSALLKAGLKPIAADPGTTFDPHLHEAVSTLPSDTTPAEIILELTRRGYLLGSRLLRAAQVVVSRGPAAPADAEGQDG